MLTLRKSIQNWITRWVRNLDKGQDPHGNALADYSQSYKDQIQEQGNSVYYYVRKVGQQGKKPGVHRGKRYPKSISPVNLLVSGSLRRSIQTKNIPDGAEIFFQGKHPTGISNSELAEKLLKKRSTWFEADDEKDVKPLTEELGEMATQLVLSRLGAKGLLK